MKKKYLFGLLVGLISLVACSRSDTAKMDYLGHDYKNETINGHSIVFLQESNMFFSPADKRCSVSVEVKNVADDSISIEITNDSASDVTCEKKPGFTIMSYSGNKWNKIDYSGTEDNNEITIKKGEKKILDIPIKGVVDLKTGGRYRISSEVSFADPDNDVEALVYKGEARVYTDIFIDTAPNDYSDLKAVEKTVNGYTFSYSENGEDLCAKNADGDMYQMKVSDVKYDPDSGQYIAHMELTNKSDKYLYCNTPSAFKMFVYDGTAWSDSASNASFEGIRAAVIAPGEKIEGEYVLGSEKTISGSERLHIFTEVGLSADGNKDLYDKELHEAGIYPAYADIKVTK